ncbi:LOW PSII ACCUMULATION chloroplastic [Micractinium conductrix]|uniref:LOW PSII ACCUMULATION chloroplastic n=1 Tax=Micractinium conductrix TaxID=554055 RepID=A0A2P6VES8_9CHLO|nr:LOW PSII ACCUMULATION chloroplastic [Micractinium conductrix]|eukprot:PSC72600.1 LOW PSII ACCUMULATION chloroplastic [Micractinium conductrix]
MAALRPSQLLHSSSSSLCVRAFTVARPQRHGRVLVSAEQQQEKAKGKPKNPLNTYRPPSREGASLRAEAEAPFRSLRLFLFGAGVAGASLATLFGLPNLIGALGGAPNATKSVAEALQDFAINIGSLAACGYFVKGDLEAREKQMARLLREDELGACQLELANGRMLRLAQTRGFARAVLVAGTPQQVAAAMADAEPYKQQLQERGVLVVPLSFISGPSAGDGDSAGSDAAAAALAVAPTAEDVRWRATPLRLGAWRQWFEQQAKLANKKLDQGLYISLRLDGRVRGSGVGSPPWAIMAAQLPPTEGFFGGLLDGMDGKV